MRIETDRLVLRPWQESDRAPLASVLGDPEVRRFYPTVLTVEQAGAQFDYALARQAEVGFHFGAAELKATGQFVGLIGLGYIPDETRAAIRGNPAIEIGWQFDRSVWGQGLAPEGARALLAYGFGTLGLDEIVAFTFRGNLPSQRVMEKAGMTRDPAADFEHPRLELGHPLRPHVVYRIAR
ncbi:GNAT family N-acetyltransferase [Devosia sp. CN2-171]|uniref:GNAT family N-acetyltransferase n=1 Tax=Devosia sp. CN2-171 TaxID=3400909 RepID=UPI003BF7DFDF